MKSRKTLLSDSKMEDIFQSSHRDNGRKEIFREIAQAQAEISFKAGAKEVVRFTEYLHKKHFGFDMFLQLSEWQAQLKEWY